MLKRSLAALLIAALLQLLMLSAAPVGLAETQTITIYHVPESIRGKVTLPAGAITSYQFPQRGNAEYSIYGVKGSQSDYYLRVSDSGLATTLSDGNDTWEKKDITVAISQNGQRSSVVFHIINANLLYADQVMDNYLRTEITADMTDLEKARKVADIAARNYDYINGYASWQDLIWFGGGTCWASASFVAEGCRRLGLKAGVHTEPWESSSHRNAIVLIDDTLYVLEAGYEEPKPRRYTMYTFQGDYFYGFTGPDDSGVRLLRYERMFADPDAAKTIAVPATYEGVPVTEIGSSSTDYILVFSGTYTETITLPATVQTIQRYAFYGDSSLRNITLPQALTSIGAFAFFNCCSLGSLVIPPKVTELREYTFAYCDALTLTVPPSVTAIADTCFEYTDVTLVVERFSYAERYAKSKGIKYRLSGKVLNLPAGLKRIEASAFEKCAANGVEIPSGCVSIGANAFANCSDLRWVDIPASVTSIDSSAFSGVTGITICAPSGSEGARFAQKNGFTCIEP